MILRIRKRDGRIVDFDQHKITQAIWKAAKSVGGTNLELSEKISNQVCAVLEVFFKDQQNIPNVEQIQDLVEKILIENGHAKTAKAYILYREERSKIRAQKAELGADETKLLADALKILQKHFIIKDGDGKMLQKLEPSANFNAIPRLTQETTLSRIEEVLPPPITSGELSENQIRVQRKTLAPFKNLKQKHCPKCGELTQTGNNCLMCLHCGFSAGVV